MDAAATVRTKADLAKNVLYMFFEGRVTLDALKRANVEVEGIVGKMKPGFSLVTDLVDLGSMDLACSPAVDQVMDICQRHHIGMVIRIIPDPRKDIGFNILGRFHYGRNVRIVTCETREEAERVIKS